MEENKLKLKLTKIFTSSCKTQNISKVIDHQKPILTSSQNHSIHNQNTPFSSPYPSIPCKPRCHNSFDQMILQNCTISRRKMAGKYTILNSSSVFDEPHVSKHNKKKKKMKKTKQKCTKNQLRNTTFSSDNETDEDGGDWFSSDDDYVRKSEVSKLLFSFSSDSEKYYPTRIKSNRVRRPRKKKVKDIFAVVKSSSDPYKDFRTSMVEMIMEKQIFGANELENLLHCFLSLNSPHHRIVIVEAFSEIWDALFSYSSLD